MDGGPLTLARDFKALKVDILSTGKDHVSPDLVADCQRRGIQVWVWTVNSLHFMERLLVSVELELKKRRFSKGGEWWYTSYI